jgi:hypothetical protein
MSLIAEPTPEVQNHASARHRRKWAMVLVAALTLVALVLGGAFYYFNRGPSWTLWVSGDGDFRHHFVPVSVTATAHTTQGASVTLRVTNDLTSPEGLQCVAFAGPAKPTYDRTGGFATGTVYYHSGSQGDEVTGGPVSVGTFRAGQTRTVTMTLIRTGSNKAVPPISVSSLTAQCFAEQHIDVTAFN